jgi:hypothetical protein
MAAVVPALLFRLVRRLEQRRRLTGRDATIAFAVHHEQRASAE